MPEDLSPVFALHIQGQSKRNGLKSPSTQVCALGEGYLVANSQKTAKIGHFGYVEVSVNLQKTSRTLWD